MHNTAPAELVETFSAFASPHLEDEQVDLIRAALAIARTEYPQLEIEKYAARIERMPGHFLLKHYGEDGQERLIDCFNRGDILSRQDCQTRLDEIYSGEMKLRPEFLHPISRRQILTRMLNNLKTVYLSTRNFRKALPLADLVLVIYPRSAEDLKQRALLRYSMGLQTLAGEDLEQYLKMSPNASDAEEIKQMSLSIRRMM